jgi:hypothetical protein
MGEMKYGMDPAWDADFDAARLAIDNRVAAKSG